MTALHRMLLLVIVSHVVVSPCFSQNKSPWLNADLAARTVPDSVTGTAGSLASWFTERLHSEKELVRAFYVWEALSVSYDFEKLYRPKTSDDPAVLVESTLASRSAVCEGYAQLFRALCDASGIECHFVPGYTRQQGRVQEVNHAWIMARVDSAWYGFDPTWGSGLVLDGRYVRKFNPEHFMVPPAVLIRTHMPFDPLWQCLEHPVSAADFAQGVFHPVEDDPPFSYRDSIADYRTLSRVGQYAAALRRLEKSGVTTNSAYEYRQFLDQSIRVDEANRKAEERNRQVAVFNEAVADFNASSFLFNDYINYWNRQFRPMKPDAEIRAMLDTCIYHLSRCRDLLEQVSAGDKELQQNREILLKAVSESQAHLDEQNAFLAKYFSTPNAFRLYLFTKKQE